MRLDHKVSDSFSQRLANIEEVEPEPVNSGEENASASEEEGAADTKSDDQNEEQKIKDNL